MGETQTNTISAFITPFSSSSVFSPPLPAFPKIKGVVNPDLILLMQRSRKLELTILEIFNSFAFTTSADFRRSDKPPLVGLGDDRKTRSHSGVTGSLGFGVTPDISGTQKTHPDF
jgi:hypothetical protein